ncbi:MAG: Cysteine-tRNA ligase [Parcubacteria group bacterium GW2011_GWA1_50_14]|nr:MAG: Cysteine-tRNA ligase [Parcubacteria group bacterium GW2011_GWA1_50_14]
MKLFNTLSGKKEDLSKSKGNPLRLFVCGPTVYDYLHIGNARTYLVFDAFVKYLSSTSTKVFYLQNITDIDDKIITRAAEEGAKPEEIAAKFQRIYFQNTKDLGITAVDKYAPATEFIPEIAEQIKTLLKKGYAYKIPEDGIYFDIAKFRNYGRLARRTALQAEDATSRIDESIKKKNRGDFVLWKYADQRGSLRACLPAGRDLRGKNSVIVNGDPSTSLRASPSWSTPLGWGRPGWHIEDTAITEKFFGPQYDIHGGGIDLKFPHHEAEIAQQESASGKTPFVKIWMHVGTLTVNGEKMSKSKGNYISIADFLKRYPADVLRLIALTHHYRSPINYTETLVRDHLASWNGLLEFLGKLHFVEKHAIVKHVLPKGEIDFSKELEDDFNTPKAIGAIFKRVSNLQPKIWKFSKSEARGLYTDIASALRSLGFSPSPPKIPAKIEAFAKEREKSRRNKQFVQADALRKEIDRLGYVIEDTPLGPYIWGKHEVRSTKSETNSNGRKFKTI